jgi:hypothetical protein
MKQALISLIRESYYKRYNRHFRRAYFVSGTVPTDLRKTGPLPSMLCFSVMRYLMNHKAPNVSCQSVG